jgi:hypothetical protein
MLGQYLACNAATKQKGMTALPPEADIQLNLPESSAYDPKRPLGMFKKKPPPTRKAGK